MNFLQLLFLTTLRNLDSIIGTNNNRDIVSTTNQLRDRYDNYMLCSVTLRNETQSSIFYNLFGNQKNFDLWLNTGDIWHIMVSPKKLMEFRNLIQPENLKMKILIPNIQRLIDQELILLQKQPSFEFAWSRYHTLEEINDWLNSILNSYPNVTQAINIGKSYEGREIRGIKISYKPNNPGIFIESNIHAREWITSATATWIINELLTTQKTEFRFLAENYDWYIVPVLNVDGFVYSHKRDRLWRKTRRPTSNDGNCFGVDGNRNYNNHWMENGGATSNPCDNTYAGPYPFSEPEIRSLANYVQTIKNRINILLAFHSYGQKLLTPFGYTNSQKPDNYGDLMHVANAFSEAVHALPYQTQYQAGTTSGLLYIASGDTADWAYAQGIRLTYTIEFRDQGRYGFLLPPAYIVPNGQEVLTGIFAMVTEADHLGYMNLKYKARTS